MIRSMIPIHASLRNGIRTVTSVEMIGSTSSTTTSSTTTRIHQPPPQVIKRLLPFPQVSKSSTSTNNTSTIRSFATGSRGSRGYGWFYHYRQGRGGRHLQGEYYDRDSIEQCMAWNQSILDLGSQRVYMDIIAEPRRNVNSTPISPSASASSVSVSTTTTADGTSSTSSNVTKNINPKKQFIIPPMDTLTGEKNRIIIDIASTVLPATCENFINLIQRKNTSDSEPSGYSGTRLYRIEKNVGIYGGDVLTNTGRTGMAYNAVALTKDVSNTDPIPMWHIPGTITMIVPTVHEIDSRFLMCTQHAPHIDGMCRPFGMMTPESLLILQKWQMNLLTLKGGIPNAFDLYIVDCGVLSTAATATATSANTSRNNSSSNIPPANQQIQQEL